MFPATSAPSAADYGVYSEVGKLRKVLVCAPGLAHERLTPTNREDLLFDDVMWVENAQRDHADFVAQMTSRGVASSNSTTCWAPPWTSPRPGPGCWTARSSPTASGWVWWPAPGPSWTR